MAAPCPKCGSQRPRAKSGGRKKSRLENLCGPCYIKEKQKRRKAGRR